MARRMDTKRVPEEIRSLERPCPALWKYYVITAVLTGPALIITLPVFYFHYYTMRYRFDEEGIADVSPHSDHADSAVRAPMS